jgi:hypothetical protein
MLILIIFYLFINFPVSPKTMAYMEDTWHNRRHNRRHENCYITCGAVLCIVDKLRKEFKMDNSEQA